jgi:TorA maturation chaperone TorD
MIDDGIAIAEDEKTLAGTAMEGSNLYGFLATVFRDEPSADFIEHIRAPAFLTALGEVQIDLDTGFLEGPDKTLLEELAVEFARLFLGPGPHISPHESAQSENAEQLLGPQTRAVERFIQGAGFDYTPDFHGLPDHISVELEFMADLARLEGEAWDKGDFDAALNCLEYEKDFLETHLGQWAPGFCRKVEEQAELPLYGAMARLTAAFLTQEQIDVARRREVAMAGQENT